MVMDAGLDSPGHDTSGWDAASQEKAGFSGTGSHGHAAPDMPDPQKLAQEWITLWQSELAAMAADPEIRESWQTVMALWAATMSTMLGGMPRAQAAEKHDRASGQARPADAARTTAAAAAHDARDAEIERLARHVAALEHRLADLERGGNPQVHQKRGSGRKPRK